MEKKILSLNPTAADSGLKSQKPKRGQLSSRSEVVVERGRRRPGQRTPPRALMKKPVVEKPTEAPTLKPQVSEEVLERRARALLEEQKRFQAEEIKRNEELERALREQREQEVPEVANPEPEEVLESEPPTAKMQEEPSPAAALEPIVSVPATQPEMPKGGDGARKVEKRRAKARDESKRSPGRVLSYDERRRRNWNVATALNENERQRSLAQILRSQERKKRKATDSPAVREKIIREVQVPETIVVQELANRMAERVADVVKKLMQMGVITTQNQSIDADTAELIVGEFGHQIVRVSDADVEDVIETVADKPQDLQPRPPVITVMGHVDHGKTSLLDKIRETNVIAGEAGGITQHIGAYQVQLDGGRSLTFLDTPGHAAFTAMRARGAQVTDIVVLVVAADDSVMPQTVEAINHAKAADVPIIVAINKCDRPGADPDRVRNELLNHSVIVEQRSGDVPDAEISALNGDGIDDLLEIIWLQAEVLELTANPSRAAEGAVIEAKLDIGRGPVATILVQKGTLRNGDIFVVGEQWGKVRALIGDGGTRANAVGPSAPVEVLGLNGTPFAGDVLNVVETESQAREISQYRRSASKEKRAATGVATNLEQLMMIDGGISKDSPTDLQIVVKADVQGSVEAISQAVEKIGNDEVRVRVLHAGVGAITESDVGLAEASGALVIGFNVRANAPARAAVAKKGIDIRYYSVIYALVDDITNAASGLLSAEIKETFLGQAEILQIYKITGSGTVAGCRVTDGVVRRSAGVRLLRDNVVIHEGRLKTLKRFKDEVSEVHSGQECGMAFENYANIRQGDHIEIFLQEEIQRSL